MAAHAGVSLPAGFRTEADQIGPELGRKLIEVAEQPFEHAQTLPLVSDGDLFAALVLLFTKEATRREIDLQLAAGLVDLAAAMLGKGLPTYTTESRSLRAESDPRDVGAN